MKKKSIYGILVVFLFLSSCQSKVKRGKDKSPVLVSMYGKQLRWNDIDTATLAKLSGEDSIEFILQQENAWINEQILLKKAEETLTDDEKKMEKKIAEYRNNLLLYAFRERFVLEEMDTAVSEEEIEEFYLQNKENFELKRNIAKILFVKVTKENYKDEIKTWMQNNSEENMLNLQNFCKEFASNYFLSDSNWLYFEDIWKEIPISKTYNRERFMNSNKFLTFEEDPYIYLLKMVDFRIKNSLSPLEFEKGKIREIILNKRKISLIKNKESELIKAAYANGDVKILRETNK